MAFRSRTTPRDWPPPSRISPRTSSGRRANARANRALVDQGTDRHHSQYLLRSDSSSEISCRIPGDDVENSGPAPSQGCTRPAGPTSQGEHDGQVPVAQALPRRAGARQRCPDGPVEARRGRGPHPFHVRPRRSAREQRGVHRRTGAVARRRVGPLRRRGAAAGDRRPVRRDEGLDRGMDGDRRRQLRASDRARRRAVGRAWGRRRTDPRMAGAPTLPGRAALLHPLTVDDVELRELVPRVLSVLVRRGADFATAEDAVQEALVRALSAWQRALPADPTGWLITVAWRVFVDMTRSEAARRDREVRFDTEPPAGAVSSADDTLHLYFLCAHPALTSSSAVASPLRSVGSLTTRQIARAYLVPEPTMAQRISRAKGTVRRAGA